MSAYRFCRTDDMGLLVEALHRCWQPHVPAEPAVTLASFKASIRHLQVWCSSCMVAFAGDAPIAVLIGAKRRSATLVYRIGVHPEHCRQGHARHLLESLRAKLAILGPPSIVAEVPAASAAGRALFLAAGYREDASLVDYVRDSGTPPPASPPAPAAAGLTGRFVIPITVGDLAANGLLQPHGHGGWERGADTITAYADDARGLAIASDERIEAFVLYLADGTLLALRSLVDDDGARLAALLDRVTGTAPTRLTLAKVHPDEVPAAWLEALGFRSVGVHRRFSACAAIAPDASRVAP